MTIDRNTGVKRAENFCDTLKHFKLWIHQAGINFWLCLPGFTMDALNYHKKNTLVNRSGYMLS